MDKTTISTVALVAATVAAIFWMMTSCAVQTEKEVTKRQYIAGTNVLERVMPRFP